MNDALDIKYSIVRVAESEWTVDGKTARSLQAAKVLCEAADTLRCRFWDFPDYAECEEALTAMKIGEVTVVDVMEDSEDFEEFAEYALGHIKSIAKQAGRDMADAMGPWTSDRNELERCLVTAKQWLADPVHQWPHVPDEARRHLATLCSFCGAQRSDAVPRCLSYAYEELPRIAEKAKAKRLVENIEAKLKTLNNEGRP